MTSKGFIFIEVTTTQTTIFIVFVIYFNASVLGYLTRYKLISTNMNMLFMITHV